MLDFDKEAKEEITLAMSKGSPGAIMAIMAFLEKPGHELDIFILDSLGIHGPMLCKFYKDCCGRNVDKASRTLEMFVFNVFLEDEIYENLNSFKAIPFIDDSIEIDGVPPYGKEFDIEDPVWDEWCKAQKASFKRRMASADRFPPKPFY